jgi:hypothetical protein
LARTWSRWGFHASSDALSLPCVVIAVSADIGDTDKDRVLTQARAKVVRDYLVQHFKFDDTRVKIIGLGKSPKPDETSKVEILIYS